MLYLTSFYCLLHTRQVQVFDDDEHKPIIGSCGHMICLECFQSKKSSSCPFCQKENAFDQAKPNYAAIGLIEQCGKDLRRSVEMWFSGENYGEGLCSKCVKTKTLRICLTCHRDELCESLGDELRLRMRSELDLLNLSRHAICSDCLIENPAEKGHRSVKIDDIKYSKEDIEAISSGIFMRLYSSIAPVADSNFFPCELRKYVYENIGREPGIKDCCISCLKVLDRYEVGSSCKHDTQETIEKMGTEKSLKYEINRLLIQHLERNEFSNYHKDDVRFEYNACNTFSEMLVNCTEALADLMNLGDHICQLRSIRLQHISLNTLNLVCIKSSQFAESKILTGTYRAQVKTFQRESQDKSHCKCTAIWEHNEKMLDKTSRENNGACKKYYDLRNQMIQMANYALEQDIGGCPMYFDHGIVLDASVLEELEKGSYTDFAETLENMDFDLD
ncbi:hypothetical protein CAEBREN_08090 [Caenorhabditis brenneri]|uniref:RING-type domain-containing protein n=1 Tax=Caenorhabditis brenneri TaxID=135651 RepID=G0MI82_CAEBE|nr:hypothetical protein CAEBREN_08090 [Caenorhabditis brenneri]